MGWLPWRSCSAAPRASRSFAAAAASSDQAPCCLRAFEFTSWHLASAASLLTQLGRSKLGLLSHRKEEHQILFRLLGFFVLAHSALGRFHNFLLSNSKAPPGRSTVTAHRT